jgi:phenylalanyl-tRNA synthetase beta subunit
LLAAAQRNADRGTGDLALFEVGQIFKGDKPEDQKMAASAVRRGTARASGYGRHWSGAARNVDVFDAKADALSLLGALGVATGGMQIIAGGPSFLHPGRSGTFQFGPKSAQAADKALVTAANVFDVYSGTGIPEGKKSVAISVTLQPREKTLTDTEIESVMQKIIAEVSKKTGATLRG